MKSNSNKNQIGAAFKALKVSEPYNLKHTKPAFVQPEPVGEALVSTDTLVTEVTKVTPVTKESTLTQVSLPTQETVLTQASTLNMETTQTLVTTPTKASRVTKVTPVTQVQKSIKHATSNQASAIGFEASTVNGLAKGYTRIPNVLLMHIVSGRLIRSEIMVALLIARFTISYNREMVPLSKAVVERQTGLSGPAVLDALESLTQKRVIQKTKGDHKSPNLFGLAKTYGQFESVTPPLPPPTLETPLTQASTPTMVTTVTDPLVSTPTNTLVSAVTYFKDNINIIKNTSSSSSQFLEPVLENYFSSIKAPKKKTTELEAYKTLQKTFSESEITKALDHILGFGSLHTGEPCHSPMRYLTSAMDEVLNRVAETEASLAKKQKSAQIRAEIAQRQTEQDSAAEAQTALLEAEFVKAFPSESDQAQAILEYAGPTAKTLPKIARHMAIAAWWGEINSNA